MRPSCRARLLVSILTVSLAIGGSGCAATRLKRTLVTPDRVGTLDHGSPFLKAHMRDGRLYVLSQWSVDEKGGTVSGQGELRGLDRNVEAEGSLVVPLADVALFETNVVRSSPAVSALAIVTGISVAVTAYCLANPKSCFGSCPTFYVSDGARPLLQAEGFSDAVAPSLEARDVDALYRTRIHGRELSVVMKNEALETHVVRSVRLLAAPRPEGGRVFASASGDLFFEASDPSAPSACRASEGDCLAAVRAFDGVERTSTTDGQDLAARETLELEFPHRDGPRGLVIAARQSLLSTFLFYQGLAYLGRSAGERLARLERGDPTVRAGLERLRDALGGIEVLVPGEAGGWVLVGDDREMGPLASDVKVFPLPPGAGGRVRLRMARGQWRLDWVALARLGARVRPVALEPVEVLGAGRPADKGRPLVTLPGDAYRFRFLLPREASRLELFVESRGYYLEWMRQEWMSEEDPARAATLFLDPARALRELAPLYKRQEAHMEASFWQSRFAHAEGGHDH